MKSKRKTSTNSVIRKSNERTNERREIEESARKVNKGGGADDERLKKSERRISLSYQFAPPVVVTHFAPSLNCFLPLLLLLLLLFRHWLVLSALSRYAVAGLRGRVENLERPRNRKLTGAAEMSHRCVAFSDASRDSLHINIHIYSETYYNLSCGQIGKSKLKVTGEILGFSIVVL